eukprot:CAMPEP_0172780082 /NCGR_PEP_ID=MMETSP1074-20121228/202747_1 /TAXON_ID=2916 /ORGANISM="Ceratium fusus, Strain PA161109" /LENGTH=542 /DNA_ID=CAMNT_0013617051 /DNA_START=52 /DNA_END=1680 /DNA_ORIENTATION=+
MSEEIDPLIIHDSDDEHCAAQILGQQRRTHNTAMTAVWILVAGLPLAALVLSPIGLNAVSNATWHRDGLVTMHATPCSDMGHNCNETKCCKAAGTRCYGKQKGWAACRNECVAGPDPTDLYPSPWRCTPLGRYTPGHYMWHPPPKVQPWVRMKCSNTSVSCMETRCCQDAGLACFQKNSGWAGCKTMCSDGPDPTDADNLPWKCKQLGGRTPGTAPPPATAEWVSKLCAAKSENCVSNQCCRDPGHTCFQKNTTFAKCLHMCAKGIHFLPWKCKQLGGRTPGIAPPPSTAEWVSKLCAAKSENCVSNQCCRDPGHTCFQKNTTFAKCLHMCAKGIHLDDLDNWKNWTCKQLGGRTPGPVLTPKPQKLAPWIKDHCADLHENCALSKCCKDANMQCFEQQPGHARCLYKCLANHTQFSHHHQCAIEAKGNTSEECRYNGKTWTCRELGPRTLRSWSWPSLFCTHVMRLYSYEVDIVKSQLQQDESFRGGIFACDQYAVYASDAASGTFLGFGPYGRRAHARPCSHAKAAKACTLDQGPLLGPA